MRAEAAEAVERGGAPTRARTDRDELTTGPLRASGRGSSRQPRSQERLRDAARSFERGRFREARRDLAELARDEPGSAEIRELYGLTLYRLGQWRAAARELEAFRALTTSTEQHPVLADCYRALGRWELVDELWAELREASPSAELVTEGRIVAAGSLADRGDVTAAVRLLSWRGRPPGRMADHDLRRAYALADLHERAGDLPRARELFGRILTTDPDFADTAERLETLG